MNRKRNMLEWISQTARQLNGGNWIDRLRRRFVASPERFTNAPAEPESTAALYTSLTAAMDRVDQVEARIAELEDALKRHVSGSQPTLMTLTTRGQILKLAKRGEQPEQIAGILRIPAGEVALLLKVTRRMLPPPAGAPAPPTKTSPAFCDNGTE